MGQIPLSQVCCCCLDDHTPMPLSQQEDAHRAQQQQQPRPAQHTPAPDLHAILDRPETHGGGELGIIVDGVVGSGRSSCINTLVDKHLVGVGGGQALGTTETKCSQTKLAVRDGDREHSLELRFVDGRGIREDVAMDDDQFAAHFARLKAACAPSFSLTHLLFTLNLQKRSTSFEVFNLLQLVLAFRGFRGNAFICFTQWNRNAVLAEWNAPLKKWIRKNRKRSRDQISDPPPSPTTMYECYCNYLLENLNSKGASEYSLARMATLLSFFQDRVLWFFNLDLVEEEDRTDGCLADHIVYMYDVYRQRVLDTLLKPRDNGREVVGALTSLLANPAASRDQTLRTIQAIEPRMAEQGSSHLAAQLVRCADGAGKNDMFKLCAEQG